MQTDRPGAAAHHLQVSLDFLGRYGWPDMFGLLWALAAVHLHLGEFDEAERLLEQSIAEGPYDSPGMATFSLGVRAEIAFGRGDAETGLRLWREAATRLADEEIPAPAPGLDPWTVDTHCAAVIAHARHGRLDLVQDLAEGCAASCPRCSPRRRTRCRPPSWTCPSAARSCWRWPWSTTTGPAPRAGSRWRSGCTSAAPSSRPCPRGRPPRRPRRRRLAYRAAVAEYAGLSRAGLWDAARSLATGAPSG